MAAGEGPRLAVVGAGVAGLAAAHAAVEARPDLDVVVLERERRVGGLVETEHTPEGFVVEHGADCLVASKPAGLRTAERAGLADDLVAPQEMARTTFIVRRGGLTRLPPGMAFGIPQGVWATLRSPVLSWPAKLRLAFEPVIRTRAPGEDESVADFVQRRFGRELLERVVEPLLGGIHGAPTAELSMRACMPRLQALERQHGSVVRGLARARGRAPQGGGPSVLSLRGGMDTLPRALARDLGDRVKRAMPVVGIQGRAGGGFTLRLANGDTLGADAVVLAAPAHAAAPMVEALSPALAQRLSEVRHRPVACVTMAWDQAHVPHALDGSGFVVPPAEGRATRACTWSSVKWPGRAPEGQVLLRCVVDLPQADDRALVASARTDLRDLLGIERAPRLVRVRRRAAGLPVYHVGYQDHVDAMQAEAAALGPFALAGNAQGGIGVPDCLQSGQRAATDALARLWSERPAFRSAARTHGASRARAGPIAE